MQQIFCKDLFSFRHESPCCLAEMDRRSEELTVSAILMKGIQSFFETSLNFNKNSGFHIDEDNKRYIYCH